MLYLSRLTLNPYNPGVRSDLAAPYRLHQTLMRGVDGQARESRLLFRLEPEAPAEAPILLVQTQTLPNWDSLLKNGYLRRADGPKALNPESIQQQMYRFRLMANPVKKVRKDGKNHSVRVPLKRARYSEEEFKAEGKIGYLQWLERQGNNRGFKVANVTDMPKAAQPTKGKGKHFGVLFDGFLQVTDAEKVQQALTDGIGPAKAFGFGLLSLAPAH